MPISPYNPQEVLGPLMKRFGRHLPGPRAEGYGKMVPVICEELHVDDPHARQLLDSLVNSHLIAYEVATPATTGDQILPASPSSQAHPEANEEQGAWRLGPPIA